MIDLSDYKFSCLLEVRFADIDGMGHVNNAKYFTYMETARIMYMQAVAKWNGRGESPNMILAHISCDYKLSLVFGDQVRVYMRVTRLGRTSFNVSYLLIREEDDALVAEGESVQVVYDYQTAQAIPIPSAWRDAITDYEPGLTME